MFSGKIHVGVLAASLGVLTIACQAQLKAPLSVDQRSTTDTDVAHANTPLLDAEANSQAAVGATAKLRLMETTDLHVTMEAFDYYQNKTVLDAGLVRTATLIRRARAEVQNSMLVDNGDLLQGTPLGDWFHKEKDPKTELHTVFKAMNLLGYDVGNVGNHDFNYGLDFLEASMAGANFPHVNANVNRIGSDGKPGDTLYPPYVIINKSVVLDDGSTGMVKVGFIGFVPPQIMLWDRNNLLGKVEAADIVDTAAALVPRLKAEGADIVIAVPHSGISGQPRAGGDENAVYYLADVPGIDAILCGHSHLRFPSDDYKNIVNADLINGRLKGIPTVMAGFWGSHLGVVDLSLKKTATGWAVTGGTGALRETKSLVKPDDVEADVRDAVAADHQATLTYLQTQVGTSSLEMDTFFSQVAPSMAVELVQQAQLWYAKNAIAQGGSDVAALAGLPILSASAPLKAGAKPDDYTDVVPGPLTLRNVADLYVYPNTLKIVKLSGAQVLEWLEMSASGFNQIVPTTADAKTPQALTNQSFPAYNFDTILGVTYAIDLAQPARYKPKNPQVDNANAHRIVDLQYNGAAIDLTQQFLVVTNNYRANGGGGFPGLDGKQVVLDPNKESRQILSDYVTATVAVSARLEPHWHLVPMPAATNVMFRSSPNAKTKVAEVGGLLEYVDVDSVSGFANYHVHW